MRIFPAVWHKDCATYHGRLLTGTHAHYCGSWDDLPVDETCQEFAACACFAVRPAERVDVLTPDLTDDGNEVV